MGLVRPEKMEHVRRCASLCVLVLCMYAYAVGNGSRRQLCVLAVCVHSYAVKNGLRRGCG